MGHSEKYRFRLFVAGDASNSMLAIANLNAFCREHLPQRHHIELVDVFERPDLALANRVLMTPTLVKLAPAPQARIVGTLSGGNLLLQSLLPQDGE